MNIDSAMKCDCRIIELVGKPTCIYSGGPRNIGSKTSLAIVLYTVYRPHRNRSGQWVAGGIKLYAANAEIRTCRRFASPAHSSPRELNKFCDIIFKLSLSTLQHRHVLAKAHDGTSTILRGLQ